MRIAVILPRGMTFSPAGASAIDLCVRDFVAHSRFSASTTVIGEAVPEPFPGIGFQAIPRDEARGQAETARLLADAARALAPDLVVVHQHLPIATDIARRLAPVPVILHKHNLPKAGGVLSRWRHARQYARFRRTIWVSDDARGEFARHFPRLAPAAVTLHNGLAFAEWKPAAERSNEVLVVGRASPEKGIAEAADALAAVLPDCPGWRARFILSRLDDNAGYLRRVTATLAPLGDRARVLTDQPHAVVKQACETAAIAVVPSLFREPFGRTALEALAGGAALVSSTRGGLSEIIADSAIALPDVTPQTIANAVGCLIDEPKRRETLAAAGRANAAKRFEISDIAAKLDSIYEAALG